MTRIPLLLAMFSLGACAQRDVSRSMQRSAMQAALQTQLKAAERDAAPDDFWLGMEAADGVVLADGRATEPVVMDPVPTTDLVEPEATTFSTELSRPPLQAEAAPPTKTSPLAEQPTDAPTGLTGLDALTSLRASGSSADVVRALDELRWTMTLEARLADKQRLIDGLSARLDGAPSGKDATTGATTTTDKTARAELAAVQKRLESAEEQARSNATAMAALTERLAAAEAASPAPSSDEPLAIPSNEPSAEMEAIDALRAEMNARPTGATNDDLLAVVADLRAQVGVLAAQQQAQRATPPPKRRWFRRRPAPQPAPVLKPLADAVPTEVTGVALAPKPMAGPLDVSVTGRLAALRAERDAMEARMAALEEAGDDARLDAVDAAMEGLAADGERLQALEAAVASSTLDVTPEALDAELRAMRTRQLAAEQAYSTSAERLSVRLEALASRGVTVRAEGSGFRVELPDDAFDGTASLTAAGLDHLRALAVVLEPFDSLRIKIHGPDGSLSSSPSRASVIGALKNHGLAASPAVSVGNPRVVLQIESTSEETP